MRTDFELVWTDFGGGVTRTPEWRAEVNEMGEIPVLEDFETRLTQTAPILLMLAERYGRFGGNSDEERFEILRWLFWDNHKLTSFMATYRFMRAFMPNADPQVLKFLRSRLDGFLAIVDAHLRHRDFMVGNKPTIADLSMIGYLFFPKEETGYDFASTHPAVQAWLGMVEAPLFIRPYLTQLRRSELFLVMTGGMAGIAGTVLVLYATLLSPFIPDASAHFVIASVLSAPASILISLIMVPETEAGRTGGALDDPEMPASSTMDAIVKGASAGVELLVNIVALLMVLAALMYLVNALLGLLPDVGGTAISAQRILGYVMAPVCWLMGLPWDQAKAAGPLMGVKTVLNEFIAYLQFAKLEPDTLDARSRLIMLYALCGFANFASLGIMIGGLGTMAPQRRDEINALGLKSIVSGTLTTCLMGAIVGVLT